MLTIGVALAMPTAAIAATPVADAGPEKPELARDTALTAEHAEREADATLERKPGARTLTVAGGARVAAGELRSGSAELLNPGPFNPLDGKPDYGNAENAFGNARGRPHEGQDILSPPARRSSPRPTVR